jgi:hypothetical protein
MDDASHLVPLEGSGWHVTRLPGGPAVGEEFDYWCLHDDNGGTPGPVMPSSALDVHREDGRLVVRSRRGDGDFDLLEVLGEQLVDRFVKTVRQAGQQSAPAPVTISEVLSDLAQNWLVDPV